MLHSIIKKIIHYTWRPALLYYLRSDRYYSYQGLRILVKKNVFHPGFFFSTRFILQTLLKEDIRNKKILELGAGSGLISLVASQRGALVTASDINPDAIENIRLNVETLRKKDSHLQITLIQSNLFEHIPPQNFDYILINPPYYPKKPLNLAEQAWFCGAEFEYFENLFAALNQRMQPHTRVWLSLSEDCEIATISQIATKHGCRMQKLVEKRTGWEKHFIYSLVNV